MLLVRYRWLLGLLLVQAAGCTSTYWIEDQYPGYVRSGASDGETIEDLRQCERRGISVAEKHVTEVEACMRALGYSTNTKTKCWFDPPIWDNNCRQ
jgi:hypothetical protein